MNSIPQRSPTKYVLGELQAWARQIVRIESILVFPQVIPSGYLSVDTGKRLWDGQISFSGEARSTAPRQAALPTPSLLVPIEYQELVPLW